MNALDTIILLFLGSGALIGFRRGLINAIISLVAIVPAVWVGFKFYGILESFVIDVDMIPPNWVTFVSIGLTVFIAYLAIKWLGNLASGMISTFGLGLPNRIGGAIFGLLINSFIVSTGLAYIMPYLEDYTGAADLFSQSLLIPHLTQISEIIRPGTDSLFDELMQQISIQTDKA